MLIEYQIPSPKAGIKEHQSREVAAALIAAGFAVAVPVKDEDRPLSKDDIAPERKPRQWVVEVFGDDRRPVIVFYNGAFEKTVYEGPPAPQRRWSGAEQKYVMVASDCPQSVIAEYFTITGNVEAAKVARAKADREERERALASKNGRVR